MKNYMNQYIIAIKNDGIIKTVGILLRSVLRYFIGFQWSRMYLLSLSADEIEKMQLPDNLTLGGFGDKDLCDTSLLSEVGFRKLDYIQRMMQAPSRQSVVIRVGGATKCYGWISYAELEINPNLFYHLHEDEAFLLDDYCFKAYRRQGLYKKLMLERIAIVKSMGYKRITTLVGTSNLPSLAAHANWKKEQVFWWFKFMGNEYCTLKNYKRLI